MRILLTLALAALPLAACKEEAATAPSPVAMTDEALGFYCQMAMTEHDGPKGQVHLKDSLAPLFFAQVRDAIAYQRMPEQTDEITAIYVSDMSHAASWQEPGENNWVAAADAFYVLGSDAVGGMGADEIVPFSNRADAQDFTARHGGQIVRLADIPDEAVLAPAHAPAHGQDTATDPDNYLDRLKATNNTNNKENG